MAAGSKTENFKVKKELKKKKNAQDLQDLVLVLPKNGEKTWPESNFLHNIGKILTRRMWGKETPINANKNRENERKRRNPTRPICLQTSSRITLVYQSVCFHTIADRLLYDWSQKKTHLNGLANVQIAYRQEMLWF